MNDEMKEVIDNQLDVNRKKRRRGAKGRENATILKKDQAAPITVAVVEEVSGNQQKKKRRKTNKIVPKPGEDGYLSKTQLRNARKRRSKQRKQNFENGDTAKSSKEQPKIKGSKHQDSLNVTSKIKDMNELDPSTKFLSKPLSCPLVRRAKQYFLNLGVTFETYLGSSTGWRTVAKLPVRSVVEDQKEKCVIGLFQPKSHKVVVVPHYIAHHPSVNLAMSSLQNICNELKVKPFQESDGSGFLRYVCINVDRSSKLVQITLVWNSSPYGKLGADKCEGERQLDLLTTELVSRNSEFQLHSLWVHFNSKWKHADGVFDFGTPSTCFSLWKHIYGNQQIIETLDIPGISGGIKLHFQPNVFRQANLDAFVKILICIRKYLARYNKANKSDKLPSCLELYGGVGTVGLSVHDLTSNLLSSDENPFNKDCFMKSVKLLPAGSRERISYVSKNATAVVENKGTLPSNNKAEIVIVDPPRKGLDEYVLNSLTNEKTESDSCIFNQTKLLIYISCGFDAFERDCNALLKSDKWKLDHAEGHVLFPGSNAIETLAFFKSN